MTYDFHIHSCLSPCGDNDMTVNNIINMALLKELDVVALTDHNTAKNCPAFLAAAKEAGIHAVPGMELTTAEEVHAVCLFKTLDAAMAFDAYVYDTLPDIENRPSIFGDQILLDASDRKTGRVDRLLANATSISLFDLYGLMEQYGGICFPAHIDRPSFSLLSNLGFVPPDLRVHAVEVLDMANIPAELFELPVLTNSDAHYLWDISEPVNRLSRRLAVMLGL